MIALVVFFENDFVVSKDVVVFLILEYFLKIVLNCTESFLIFEISKNENCLKLNNERRAVLKKVNALVK